MALFLRSFAASHSFAYFFALPYTDFPTTDVISEEVEAKELVEGRRVVASQQGRVEVDVGQRILREAGPYNSHRGVWGLGVLVLSKRDLGLSYPLPILNYNILRTDVPNHPHWFLRMAHQPNNGNIDTK
jgi:hypothetical protein